MLRFSRALLRWLNVANWAVAAGFAGLIALLAWRPDIMVTRFGPRAAETVHLGQTILVLGIATTVAAHVILVRLVAMIDTVMAGHPFSVENGRRLRDIAWALLAIQLLDLAVGAAFLTLARVIGRPLTWGFALTGWLAVLMLFVLARVFVQGAAMQDELDATV